MFSWFISPWEAARLSLKAQQVMALQFLTLASAQGPRRDHVVSDGGQDLPPRPEQSGAPSAEPAIPAKSVEHGPPKAVAVQKRMDVVRKSIGASKAKANDTRSRRRDRRSRRKDKSRTKRS
jgi:hypothetical protein